MPIHRALLIALAHAYANGKRTLLVVLQERAALIACAATHGITGIDIYG